jgi:hypothetical protein
MVRSGDFSILLLAGGSPAADLRAVRRHDMKIWWLPLLIIVAVAAALGFGATVADVLVGLASGVLAAWLWAVIDENRRRTTYVDALKRLPGTYRVRRKGERSSDLGTVTITLEGTTLRTNAKGTQPAGAWVGELTMTEPRATSGAGTYHHTDVDGWGIHTVQVRGAELLVHAEYVRPKKGELDVDAYVWEPCDRDGGGAA